jgi:head-tail adaptor
MIQNFAKDKQEIQSKIDEKRSQLEDLEKEHRAVRARHGKESQRVGELKADRKVSIKLFPSEVIARTDASIDSKAV